MDLTTNPFQQLIPLAGNISSIQLTSSLDWLAVPADPIVGENAVLPINPKTNLAGDKVFATPHGGGTPVMLSLSTTHIPSLPISQITGLQSALNSNVVKSLSGSYTFGCRCIKQRRR